MRMLYSILLLLYIHRKWIGHVARFHKGTSLYGHWMYILTLGVT